jgi:hypothetical protein
LAIAVTIGGTADEGAGGGFFRSERVFHGS